MPAFPKTLNAYSLDGEIGLLITAGEGGYGYEYVGEAVSNAGDINHDGYDDLLIGSRLSQNVSGRAFLVFGGPQLPKTIDLLRLRAGDGFRLEAHEYGQELGYSVSAAGDINGDGIDDFVVGVDRAHYEGPLGGEAYVVFGREEPFAKSYDAHLLDGEHGFRFIGQEWNDFTGYAVASLGDFNGDGRDDIAVSAPNRFDFNGEIDVIFGADSFGNGKGRMYRSDLNPQTGLRIVGVHDYDWMGEHIGGGGDINGDGFADLVVSGERFNNEGEDNRSAYVIFGGPAQGNSKGVLNLAKLNGTNGFEIPGDFPTKGIKIGSVSIAGDVNGDGLDDLLVGSQSEVIGDYPSGKASVLFGKTSGFTASFDLETVDGNNGFAIVGTAYSHMGASVAAGDFNGDGYADVVVTGSVNETDKSYAYVIFGRPGGFSKTINPRHLDGHNGFAIHYPGGAISSAGDVNGDGFEDLALASASARADASSATGQVRIIYGHADRPIHRVGTDQADLLPGSEFGDSIAGGAGRDTILGAESNDRLDGNSSRDMLIGGSGKDTLIGGTGSDSLTGGTGADVFHFMGAVGVSNVDTITDFKPGVDKIALDDRAFAALGTAVTPSEFNTKATGHIAADKQHIIYDKSNGTLWYDADDNGSGAAVQFATLSNKPQNLTYADFVIV